MACGKALTIKFYNLRPTTGWKEAQGSIKILCFCQFIKGFWRNFMTSCENLVEIFEQISPGLSCFGQRRCSLYRTLDLYCVPQFLASVMLYVKSSLEELSWLSVKIWWKFLNIYPQERKYNTEYKLSTAWWGLREMNIKRSQSPNKENRSGMS